MKMFCGSVLALAVLGTVSFPAYAAEDAKGDPYTLNVCAVAGEELGSMGDPIVAEFEGREVRYCCSGCKPRLENDPAKYLPEVDAQMIENQMEYYPLETDVVSGKPLGDKPVDKIYKNRLVRFESEETYAKFQESPAEHLAKLNEAVIAKQKDSYPLDVCVVSGEELGSMGEPLHLVIANRMVDICCSGCAKGVNKDPLAAFKQIDEKS